MTPQIPDGDTLKIDRRAVVRGLGATAGTLALAGCLGDDESDANGNETDENTTESDADDDADAEPDDGDEDLETTPERIEIEDPPDAVYVPTHREAMRVLEPIEAGDYMLSPMLSYPHPFWVIAGDGSAEGDVERESPEEGRGVHMMFTLWDAATGTVLPVDEGVQLRIERESESEGDGEGDQIAGSPRRPWPMLSQEMGFHFGDNVALPDDGTYTVEVTIPPLSTRTTGDLERRLDERATATFEFVYDDAFRTEVIEGVEYLDEDVWGRRGALEPMGHDGGDDEDGDGHEGHHVPYSALPSVEDYPGTLLVDAGRDSDAGADTVESTRDLPRSGDAAFLATLLGSDSRLAVGDQYLLISPRTPYNRVPLADMSLRATVARDEGSNAEPVVDAPLEQTLDDEYGLHYGRPLGDVTLEPGDAVTITVESPPQVARHRGYETAFLEMPPVELIVPAEGDDG